LVALPLPSSTTVTPRGSAAVIARACVASSSSSARVT
jgi:hypothetical protein